MMKSRVWIALLIFLFASVSGAGAYTSSNVNQGKEEKPAVDGAKRQLWQSKGYGYIMEINGKSVTMYNYTRDSLLLFAIGDLDEQGNLNLKFQLGDSKQLPESARERIWLGRFQNGSLTDKMGYVKQFKQIKQFPAVKVKEISKDPVANFEVFWQTFEENFSFFPLVKVDWKEVYKTYRPKVTAATSEKELENIFKEMLGKLKDGHTNLITNENFFSAMPEMERAEFYETNLKAIQGTIESNYMNGALKSKLEGRIQYGRTKNGDAYIQLREFDVSDEKLIDEALADMVQDLADCRNFVIDMRFNRGGDDIFGLKVAGLFTGEKRLAYNKQGRIGGYDQFSEPTKIFIEPGAKRFTANKIIVLSGPLTVSAGETGTMALKKLDKVTVIGEKTSGFFSDVLFKTLPNNWIIMLSNERYTSPEGINYEQLGLPPDEQIILKQADVDAHKDSVIIRAMELLKVASK
ncbi:S41 family peptidase [Brevibacillus brevis]|uniref:S41 family peptidase n=1 Tax=Brevibacillus brevis TaxID=1393 RepID=UPI00115BA21C|nr:MULTISPECIES: S41 family peptidase [Bacillales]TQR34812.1 hypothetical protein C7Y45_16390 [Lysinibacillus sp. SDF0063]UIO42530.1 S41 family peptidase [Brevibacillus brevis]